MHIQLEFPHFLTETLLIWLLNALPFQSTRLAQLKHLFHATQFKTFHSITWQTSAERIIVLSCLCEIKKANATVFYPMEWQCRSNITQMEHEINSFFFLSCVLLWPVSSCRLFAGMFVFWYGVFTVWTITVRARGESENRIKWQWMNAN